MPAFWITLDVVDELINFRWKLELQPYTLHDFIERRSISLHVSHGREFCFDLDIFDVVFLFHRDIGRIKDDVVNISYRYDNDLVSKCYTLSNFMLPDITLWNETGLPMLKEIKSVCMEFFDSVKVRPKSFEHRCVYEVYSFYRELMKNFYVF